MTATLASAPRTLADAAISTAATQNMSCASGVCAPTASDAVPNVGDLESLLASGNVEVTTTGSEVEAAETNSARSLRRSELWSRCRLL
jgi:hypothetical protein